MERKIIEKTSNSNSNSKESGPHDAVSVVIQGHIKIFDPQTKEVFVNKRS